MITEQDLTGKREYSRTLMWCMIIILVAGNLRAPIIAVGPLIGVIRDATGISGALAGMLTTIPLLAFAVFSPFTPKLARRFGMTASLLASLVVLTLGIIIRSVPYTGTLFLGTAIVGVAIAIGNVLLPSIIKREFPEKIGLMTGVYSLSMNLWAAVASGVSIPVAQGIGIGWRGSLICWVLLSILTLAVWLPQLRKRDRASAAQKTAAPVTRLWHSSLAWQVSLFMGLQSFTFYVNAAWLPAILHQRGISYSSAGWMLSLMQFFSLPSTFIIPVLAVRSANQRWIVSFIAAFFIVGYTGLLIGSSLFMPLWIILIGIAGGASFSLAVTFFALRSRSAYEATELSGMAQSVGYLLAAAGPALFGFLHDETHDWTVSILLLIVVTILLFVFGLGAGRSKYVLMEQSG